MKYKEFENLATADLRQLLNEKKEEVRSLRFKVASRQLGNVKSIQKIRKDIARIQTKMKGSK